MRCLPHRGTSHICFYRKYAINPVRTSPQLTAVISTIVVFIITFNNEQKRKAVVSSMRLDTNKYAMSPASGDIAYMFLSQALAYRKYAITQSVFRNSPMSSSSSRAFPPVPLSSSLSLPSIMNRKGKQWLVQWNWTQTNMRCLPHRGTSHICL
jgi:hypothetical protein